MGSAEENLKLNTDIATIWRISWPVIVSSAALTFVNVTDAKFLGVLGPQEIGAASLGGNFYFVFFMIAQAIGIGTQILIARKAGEGDTDGMFRSFFSSWQIQVLIGVLLTLVTLFVAPLLIQEFYHGDEVMSLVNTYMIYRSIGLIPLFIAMAYRSFFTGIGDTKVIMWASILMGVINIPLDYFLINGIDGFIPMLGIEGAAIASGLAELVGAFVLFGAAHKKGAFQIPLRLKQFIQYSKEYTIELLKLSSPLVVQFLVANTSWLLFFMLIQKVGDYELAVSAIAKHVFLFLMVPTWGFAGAANTIVSNVIGQGKKTLLPSFTKKILGLNVSIAVLIALLNLLLANYTISLFSDDVELIEKARTLMHWISVYIVVGAVSCVLFNILTGTGDTKTSMKIEVFTIVVYLVYLFYFLHFNYIGLYVAWGSEIVYWGSLGLFAFIRLSLKHFKED